MDRSWSRLRVAGVSGVGVAMVAGVVVLGQASGSPARADTGISADEVLAGVVSVANSYPGGLGALLGLFSTGECAGVVSYADAPATCRNVLEQVRGAGAGQSAPQSLPDLGGEVDQNPWPTTAPDPDDQATQQQLAEAGAPSDLAGGLAQNPPVVPDPYNTLPSFVGGPRPDPCTPTSTTAQPTVVTRAPAGKEGQAAATATATALPTSTVATSTSLPSSTPPPTTTTGPCPTTTAPTSPPSSSPTTSPTSTTTTPSSTSSTPPSSPTTTNPCPTTTSTTPTSTTATSTTPTSTTTTKPTTTTPTSTTSTTRPTTVTPTTTGPTTTATKPTIQPLSFLHTN